MRVVSALSTASRGTSVHTAVARFSSRSKSAEIEARKELNTQNLERQKDNINAAENHDQSFGMAKANVSGRTWPEDRPERTMLREAAREYSNQAKPRNDDRNNWQSDDSKMTGQQLQINNRSDIQSAIEREDYESGRSQTYCWRDLDGSFARGTEHLWKENTSELQRLNDNNREQQRWNENYREPQRWTDNNRESLDSRRGSESTFRQRGWDSNNDDDVSNNSSGGRRHYDQSPAESQRWERDDSGRQRGRSRAQSDSRRWPDIDRYHNDSGRSHEAEWLNLRGLSREQERTRARGPSLWWPARDRESSQSDRELWFDRDSDFQSQRKYKW